MVDSTHDGLLLLHELLSIPSPSGREERMGVKIAQLIEDMGYRAETDSAGNVLVRLVGKETDAGLAVLAAHLDEVSVLVTHIEENGKLRVDGGLGLPAFKLGERPMLVVGDQGHVTGILSFGSVHGSGDQLNPTWSQACIVTGLSLQQLAACGIRRGSTTVPIAEHRGPVLFGDPTEPFVAAWTLDDRLGVVSLLRLLKKIQQEKIVPRRPMIIAFTVHEEGGCHGAKVLAHRERPEIFVAVDGCPILPDNGIENDGRPTTWSHDAMGHLDQRLIGHFQEACSRAGTSLQVNVFARGAYSDASAVYNAGAVPRVGIIGHARENSHGFEFTQLSSFDHLLHTLVYFVQGTW